VTCSRVVSASTTGSGIGPSIEDASTSIGLTKQREIEAKSNEHPSHIVRSKAKSNEHPSHIVRSKAKSNEHPSHIVRSKAKSRKKWGSFASTSGRQSEKIEGPSQKKAPKRSVDRVRELKDLKNFVALSIRTRIYRSSGAGSRDRVKPPWL
jgi:hypothetical protein